MTEKQKMPAGQLYDATDPELAADRARAASWMVRCNTMLAAAEQHQPRPRRVPNLNCVVPDVVRVTIRAGSVVTRDVPDGATAFGNPAQMKQ